MVDELGGKKVGRRKKVRKFGKNRQKSDPLVLVLGVGFVFRYLSNLAGVGDVRHVPRCVCVGWVGMCLGFFLVSFTSKFIVNY